MLAVRVSSTGRTEVIRTRAERGLEGIQDILESLTFTLSRNESSQLLALATSTGTLRLRQTYRDPRRHDGEQLILSVRLGQGTPPYEVFSDNYWPEPLEAFSSDLERLLDPHLIRGAWQQLSWEQFEGVTLEYWGRRGWSG